jgi:hypothetical protein
MTALILRTQRYRFHSPPGNPSAAIAADVCRPALRETDPASWAQLADPRENYALCVDGPKWPKIARLSA